MSNREYLDILCNTGDGVFIVDSNRHIIRWNKAAEKILKYPESEVLNHECYRVISGRVLPDKVFCGQNCKIHNDVFKGNTQQNFDLRTQTGEGEPLWLNISIIAPGNSDEPFIAHILRDVTRAKRRELALQQFLSDLESSEAAASVVFSGEKPNSYKQPCSLCFIFCWNK